MHRRKLLKTAGAVAGGLTLAGCAGQTGSEANETEAVTDTPASETTEAATTAGNETAGNETAGNETAGTADGDLADLDGELGDSPEGLEVASQELYQTNGEVGLRGTVENTSDMAYATVEAEVTLQDDQGEILYEFIDETEEAQTASLPAGESWQFDVLFEEAQMAEVTNYTINLDGDVAGAAGAGNESAGNETADVLDGEIADDTDPNFEILGHQFSRSGESASVTGEIENTGDETANSVEVSVTLFDEQDDEIDVFTNSLEEENDIDQLAPGDTWQFDVQFTDVDMQNVGYYRVSVDSDLI